MSNQVCQMRMSSNERKITEGLRKEWIKLKKSAYAGKETATKGSINMIMEMEKHLLHHCTYICIMR